MTKIKTLKRWNKDHTKREAIAPRTHVKAVYDNNGNTLDSLMAVQDEKLSELESNYEENPEFVKVVTDAEGKALFGIKKDGTCIAYGDLEVVGKILNEAFEKKIDNEVHIMKGQVEKAINDLSDKLSYFSDEENPEWLHVTTDAEGNVLWGIRKNGEVVFGSKVSLNNENIHTEQDFMDISKGNFDYHEECIFHDNFSRTTPDNTKPWMIGSNSSGVSLPDKYGYNSIYSDAIDDGFRLSEVNGECRLVNKTSDVKGFRLVKSLSNTSSIVVEVDNNSTPNVYQSVCFNVKDADNYELLRVHRKSLIELVIEYVVCVNGVELHRDLPISQQYNGNAIRFYFIGEGFRVLLDDTIVYTGKVRSAISNIGLHVEGTRDYSYKFLNIYYISKDKTVIDTSGSVDKGITEGVTFTVGQSQTIDESKTYCYTLVSNVVKHGYCERFEVRNNGALTVTDDRQENMFIPQKLPILGKWHLSFDLMFPSDFVVDTPGTTDIVYDCFFQLHESAMDAHGPCIMMTTEPSIKNSSEASIFIKIESFKQQVQGSVKPYEVRIKEEIYPVEPGVWHHFDIYVKQGYMSEHNPLLMVLIDGKELFRSFAPNSYNVAKQDYPKYGMYKPMWSGGRTTGTDKRIIYFDNVRISY